MALQRSTLEEFFTKAWTQRGVAARLMLPLSWLFGGLTALRRLAYRSGIARAHRLPVPVVVVGNIFVGGTGKTPLTIWLVQALRQAGFHPGVISRGYGSSGDAPRMVTSQSLAQEVGDEPLLIADRTQCPVVVSRDRIAAAQMLLTAYPQTDIIIADDGLQHYRLARDIEVVLFDSRGTGNGWLLPAGPLREPMSRRRDFTVVNGSHEEAEVLPGAFRMRLTGLMAEHLVSSEETTPRALRSFAQTVSGYSPVQIVAAAGIGNPARFFTLLREAGLQFREMALPDHYDFVENPFAGITAEVILITEKDAVKCRQNAALKNDPRIWVVPVTAQINLAFAEQIVEKLRGHSIA